MVSIHPTVLNNRSVKTKHKAMECILWKLVLRFLLIYTSYNFIQKKWEDNVPNVTKDEKKENEKDKDKNKEKEKEKKKEQIKKFFEIIGKHLTQLLEDELYTVYSGNQIF